MRIQSRLDVTTGNVDAGLNVAGSSHVVVTRPASLPLRLVPQ